MERFELIENPEYSRWRAFEGKTVLVSGRASLYWPIDQNEPLAWNDKMFVVRFEAEVQDISMHHIPAHNHQLPERFEQYLRVRCETPDGGWIWFHEDDICAIEALHDDDHDRL